jgi:hypothetical protein
VLLRLAYLGVANALAMLRLLPMSDRAKDGEILALRHQLTVLERRLHGQQIRFTSADRALLAALLHRLPRQVLRPTFLARVDLGRAPRISNCQLGIARSAWVYLVPAGVPPGGGRTACSACAPLSPAC